MNVFSYEKGVQWPLQQCRQIYFFCRKKNRCGVRRYSATSQLCNFLNALQTFFANPRNSSHSSRGIRQIPRTLARNEKCEENGKSTPHTYFRKMWTLPLVTTTRTHCIIVDYKWRWMWRGRGDYSQYPVNVIGWGGEGFSIITDQSKFPFYVDR